MWFFIIFAVLAIISLLIQRYSSNKRVEIMQHPLGREMFKRIEAFGKYDGSEAQEDRALDAFKLINFEARCGNKRIMDLYLQTLKSSNLPIPLAAAYAFSIGGYIEDSRFGIRSDMTRDEKGRVMLLEIMYPNYMNYVIDTRPRREVDTILLLSCNMLNAVFWNDITI